ncbi:hypothetical protein E2C01_027723 [Portunus trituberculatus]|uniref:Uncharacterized protein n=1 Tax=Portunus trituberculatus TaxID=210409 RepID=A0A5B7ELY2_PORTR|nr:hypothetical protein [Portunus trituberculatus]
MTTTTLQISSSVADKPPMNHQPASHLVCKTEHLLPTFPPKIERQSSVQDPGRGREREGKFHIIKLQNKPSNADRLSPTSMSPT